MYSYPSKRVHEHIVVWSVRMLMVTAWRIVLQGRDHLEFVCRLKDVMPGRTELLHDIMAALPHAGFELQVNCLLRGHADWIDCLSWTAWLKSRRLSD